MFAGSLDPIKKGEGGEKGVSHVARHQGAARGEWKVSV